MDTPIQMQVSRGNQFMMPDLRASSGTTPSRTCESLGWTGAASIKLPDVQNSGQRIERRS